MPLVGGFGCLELILYGIRDLAWQHYEPLILSHCLPHITDQDATVFSLKLWSWAVAGYPQWEKVQGKLWLRWPCGKFDLCLRTVLFIQLCFIYLSFYVGEEYAGENVSIQLQQGLQTSRWVEILSRNSPSQRLNKYCCQAPRKYTAPSLAGVWTEPLSVSTQVRNVNKYFTKFIRLIIL